MFPRQRQYANCIEEEIDGSCGKYYNYDQLGGSPLSKLGDLLKSIGKSSDDVASGVAKIDEPLTDAQKATIKEIDFDNPIMMKAMLDTFDLKSVTKLPPEILNKVPVERLAQITDFNKLANLDPKVLEALKKHPGFDVKKLDDALQVKAGTAGKIDDVDAANKQMADALDEIDETIEPAMKNKDLTKTGKETTESAKIDQASWIMRNKGKTFVIGTVTIGATAYAGYALDQFIKKNNAPFDIIKMELDTKDPNNSIWFYYAVKEDTNFRLTTDNWILLEKNDATPMIPINRIYKVMEVDNDLQKLKIFLQKEEMPTSLGSTGSFRYQTTFANQLKETAEDIGDLIGGSAGKVATGLFGGIAESLGISTSGLWIGLGVTIAVIVLIIIVVMVIRNRSNSG